MPNCSVCGKFISLNKHLNRHLREIHGVFELKSDCDKQCNMKCGKCSLSFPNNDAFLEHIKNEHDFCPVTDEVRFNNEQEFADWKRNVEEEHKIEFVVRTSKTGRDCKTVYYRCNRSGPMRIMVSDECRKRKPKMGKSCKTNLHCPAMITAKISPSHVDVKFCKSHFGHEVELHHLHSPSLPKESKEDELETSAFIGSLPEESNRRKTLEDCKQLLANDVNDIISDCKSFEELKVLQELMKTARPIIDATRKTGIKCRRTTKSPQRRLVTKRKRRDKNSAKPEPQCLTTELLLPLNPFSLIDPNDEILESL